LVTRGDESDIPAVVAIIHAAFVGLGDLDPPSGALSENPESLSKRLRSESLLVAHEGAALVGCLFCALRGESLYLGRVAVDPSRRGRGIGAELIEAAAAEARRQNLARLIVGVRIALPANRRFFERCGFQIVGAGCHAGHSRATFFMMSRALT